MKDKIKDKANRDIYKKNLIKLMNFIKKIEKEKESNVHRDTRQSS